MIKSDNHKLQYAIYTFNSKLNSTMVWFAIYSSDACDGDNIGDLARNFVPAEYIVKIIKRRRYITHVSLVDDGRVDRTSWYSPRLANEFISGLPIDNIGNKWRVMFYGMRRRDLSPYLPLLSKMFYICKRQKQIEAYFDTTYEIFGEPDDCLSFMREEWITCLFHSMLGKVETYVHCPLPILYPSMLDFKCVASHLYAVDPDMISDHILEYIAGFLDNRIVKFLLKAAVPKGCPRIWLPWFVRLKKYLTDTSSGSKDYPTDIVMCFSNQPFK